MNIDFSKIDSSVLPKTCSPRDIFMSLTNDIYSYPRDVQSQVWEKWEKHKNDHNILIKMNTGSGKTIVGLMILKASLNENIGPAIYVCPDNYLVKQVKSQADKLGIMATTETDYHFKNNNSILITNIHKLINGQSIFGMKSSGNIKIGSIVVDDIHACLDIITEQYTVRIPRHFTIYDDIIQIFKKDTELANSQIFHDIIDLESPRANKIIPFSLWQENCEDIRKLIIKNINDEEKESIVKFNLPLIKDVWTICDCVVSTNSIEINPRIIPINNISEFNKAKRKVFMSATIADDNILTTALGINDNKDITLITPNKANDIGERLFIIPKYLNPKLSTEDIRNQIFKIAEKKNVAVIVPSFNKAKGWDSKSTSHKTQILNADTIYKGIEKINNNSFTGLTVFVNKYDGIDLPNNACELLVIDGMPNIETEYDIAIQKANNSDKRIRKLQMQKVEQGFGRGVRSNKDNCAVIIMGATLENTIVNEGAITFCSETTQKQYRLSELIWDQIMQDNEYPTVEQIFEIANLSFNKDTNWINFCKSNLTDIEYKNSLDISKYTIRNNEAFNYAKNGQYEKAWKTLKTLENESKVSAEEKGIALEHAAKYMNFINSVKSQELLVLANKYNPNVQKPIKGIKYTQISKSNNQSENILKYFNKFENSRSYILKLKAIIENMVFIHTEDASINKQNADKFEESIHCIAKFLGFSSQRPDKEYSNGGPDNLWRQGKEFAVIECKNAKKPDTEYISKKECAQLLSSIEWFNNEYGCEDNKYSLTPIIIHPSKTFDKDASPSKMIRVVTNKQLDLFKNNLVEFFQIIATSQVSTKIIESLLNSYNLSLKQIIQNYTSSYINKNS